jgi:hypothetical protein
MADFKKHIAFSTALGAGYAGVLYYSGFEPTHCLLAAATCGIAGMLPDLDSDSGRPVRELFGFTALAVPLCLVRRLEHHGVTPEGLILWCVGLYAGIRFGLAWLFKHMTVHRGMFHSLPAALIASECVFLAHEMPDGLTRLALAGAMFLGFTSHLVLDEIWAVDLRGLRLNKAAGSALKLFSQSIPATVTCWGILALLTYLIGVDQGYWKPLPFGKPGRQEAARSVAHAE